MNKQKYLAELRRLLVYMTDEDRDEAIRRCAGAFDAAGPEGEADLIAELGSPTKTAIGLSRGYEEGKIPDIFPAHVVKPASVPAPEPVPENGTPDEIWKDLPDFDVPAIEEGTVLSEEAPQEAAAPEAEADKTEEPEKQEEQEKAAPGEPAPVPAPTPEPEEPPAEEDEEEEAEMIVERTMSLGLGIPLFILVFCALGLPLAALCLAVSLVLIAPGLAVLFGAFLVLVGGLWSLGYMADAALLFGLAFIVLAVGLVVLCLGLWLAVKLIGAYCRGVGWVGGELLGRKVKADA